MNNLTILTVKASWSYMLANSEEVGLLFYQKLFELDPSLRAMFSDNINAQSEKLMNMLTLIISRVQKLGDLEIEIASLGRRHAHYGVKPDHYRTVGQALLWVLEHELQDRWNTQTRDAWSEVYTLVADAMIQADGVTL